MNIKDIENIRTYNILSRSMSLWTNQTTIPTSSRSLNLSSWAFVYSSYNWVAVWHL